jgi:hypothetical protein
VFRAAHPVQVTNVVSFDYAHTQAAAFPNMHKSTR